MEAVIIGGCIVAYLACALASARFWYGRERAEIIDEYASKKYSNPVQEFAHRDANSLLFSISASSLVWPVVWTFFAGSWVVIRIVGGSKHLSRHEVERDQKAKDERIAQLEKELNLVDKHTDQDLLQGGLQRHNHRAPHTRSFWE